MSASYLFRLDDICPTMDWQRFTQLVNLFERYHVKPLLGVIPNNQDTSLDINEPHPELWSLLKNLSQKGWILAQHGSTHRYQTTNGGLLSIQPKSEVDDF